MSDILDAIAPPADKRISYGPESLQFGDLRLPSGPGPHPLIVAIHGGFWRSQYDLLHLGHLCAALAKAGFATFSLEYRRVGQKGGGYPGTLEDVALGVDFLPSLAMREPIDLERVAALGHSAGGHLALWLAGRHHLPEGSTLHRKRPFRLEGVVGLAPVSDLVEAYRLHLGEGIVGEFLGGGPALVPDHFAAASPAALLPLGVPQVIVHGDLDDTVPISLSRGYVSKARARGDDVQLLELAGVGHFELIDPRTRAWGTVTGAVRRVFGE